jgi:DNA polymerase III delta subunit
MLHVFCGSDTVAVRTRALVALAPFEVDGIIPTRLEAETYESGALAHFLGRVSLFGGAAVCVLDTPSSDETFLLETQNALVALAEPPHTFVLIESAPTAEYRRQLKKHATSFVELKAEAKEKSDQFALGNALAARDKKTLWIVLTQELRSGTAPEALVGLLWYQLKTMRLAALTKTAGEAGLKEFPYKKAQVALKKYGTEEVERLSSELLDVYHRGHAENGDMKVGLEKWVLFI